LLHWFIFIKLAGLALMSTHVRLKDVIAV